jgi:BirA family biotin operon repressor/biotin-[acetyl-CoA-carboxylase] ligase
LAESCFRHRLFEERLDTRRLGRRLSALAEHASTNDAAWEALAAGAPDGFVAVADTQTRGRGRMGRSWHMAAGKGLALSLLLRHGCDTRSLGVLPLLSGLALAVGFERLGLRAELKWPNDLLIHGRKVAGILCESRGTEACVGEQAAASKGAAEKHSPGGRAEAGADRRAAVVGIGVNVSQSSEDFLPTLRSTATSLALEGLAVEREAVAAEFINAFEPLWNECGALGADPLLARWRERASFWGQTVCVQTAAGELIGVARTLDHQGRLVVEQPSGERVSILAGDLDLAGMGESLNP